MFESFLTWEIIGSYAGSIAVTTLITQWLKGFAPKLPTQILSFIIAIVLLNISEYFLAGITISSVLLSIPNSIVISTASNGAYMAIAKTIPKIMGGKAKTRAKK